MERPTGLIGPASPKPTVAYRIVGVAIRFLGRWVFGFRTEVTGIEHLPHDGDGRIVGGWIAAGLPHRTWVDPFVVVRCPAARTAPGVLRRRACHLSARGGVDGWCAGSAVSSRSGQAADAPPSTPTWPGARAALDAGAIVCLFPESGPPTPPGTARPLGLGVAYFALRADRPIVPIVLGGTHELYRGRRFRLDVLPPVTARELAGVSPDAPLPRTVVQRRARDGPSDRQGPARPNRDSDRRSPRGHPAS